MSQSEILKQFPEMYGISPHEGGFWVRLYYVNDKPTVSKWFSGLSIAKEWRDKQIKRLYVIYGDKVLPYRRKIPQKNNKSGVSGVRFRAKDAKNGNSYEAFFKNLKGNHQRATFSCDKYGEDVAYNLAVQSRILRRRATLQDL